MKRHTTLLATSALLLAAFSCADDAPIDGPDKGCPNVSPEARAANQAVFDSLAPSCSGCHASGTRGYFASIESFEALLVYQPKYVVAGDPDGSELIRLLEGDGTLAFSQMPISGPTYQAIAEGGGASMKMPAIRQWVSELVSAPADERPAANAPHITRMNARDVVRTLYAQLGLSDDDLFVPAQTHSIPHKSAARDNKYPIASFESLPAPYENTPAERFASLGGGSAMMQIKTDTTLSPSFLGTLSQVSQSWCRLALDKTDNVALLPAGTTLATSNDDPDAVKLIIKRWFLHFHAAVASDAEVDALYQQVFLPLEAETDAKTGYVGLCSSFIRHPDWIFY